MPGMFSAEALTVYQSLLPFLGSKGQNMANLAISVSELLGTDSAKKALVAVNQMLGGAQTPNVEEVTTQLLPIWFAKVETVLLIVAIAILIFN